MGMMTIQLAIGRCIRIGEEKPKIGFVCSI